MIQQQYYEILDRLHIRSFFRPESQKVTLSTEVGVFKPDARIFQAVINKFEDLRFPDVVFITENRPHVEAAR
ncbi:MAG: hypothetical protein M3380_09260, partial [Chloroflexota bacterium]|nr:hypothetical protein [Chloroflexota bacterium]